MALDWFVQPPAPVSERREPVAFQQFYAGASFLASTANPGEPETEPGWRPIYPDRLLGTPRRIQPPQSIVIRVLPPATTPDGSWHAEYPALLARPARKPQHPAFFTQIWPLDAVPLSWRATFPDQIARRRFSTATQPFYAVGSDGRGGHQAPELSWHPTFPAWIARRALPTALHPQGTRDPRPVFTVAELSWLASYPDRIPRTTLPTAALPFWAFGYQAAPPPPPLAWLPRYPDWLAPPPGLSARQQQPVVFDPFPIPKPAVVELSWASIMPDWIARAALPTAAQPFWATVLDTPTRLPYEWQATYPDRFPQPTRRLGSTATQISDLTPASPLVWVPTSQATLIYPLRRVALTDEGVEPPVSTFPALTLFGWETVYPSVLVRPVWSPSMFNYPTLSLVPSEARCVKITPVDLRQPTLVDGVRLFPFLNGDLTQPRLSSGRCLCGGLPGSVDPVPGGTPQPPPPTPDPVPVPVPPPPPPPPPPAPTDPPVVVPPPPPEPVVLPPPAPVEEPPVVFPAPGAEFRLPLGDELQPILDAAMPGDVIALVPGQRFGNYIWRERPGTAMVTLKTAAVLEDRRITPGDLTNMPLLTSAVSGQAPLTMAPSSHHLALDGIALTQTGGNTFELLKLGSGGDDQNSLDLVPHHILVDRCYLFVSDAMNQRRGIGLQSAHTVIRRCDIRNMKEEGTDSQAIIGWNGPGPYLIQDCYLEGAGENVIFGGDKPRIANLVPSDITIEDCTFEKRLSWIGRTLNVKNHFELKNARRVLFRRNRLRDVWDPRLGGAQDGFSIVLTVRGGSEYPWAIVEDVVVEYNRLSGVGSGFNILGWDTDTQFSAEMSDVIIRHNIVETDAARGDSEFALSSASPQRVTIENNTAVVTRKFLDLSGGSQISQYADGWIMRDNLSPHGLYGVFGANVGTGTPAFVTFLTNYTLAGNILGSDVAEVYPPGFTLIPVADYEAMFVDYAGGNYTVRPDSPYYGKGADVTLVPAF